MARQHLHEISRRFRLRRHGNRRAPGAAAGCGSPITSVRRRGCAAAIIEPPAPSQGLDPATLLKPPVDSWPTYHGDYTGQRHSKLTQITPDNVHQLTLAWAWQAGGTNQIKATPILVNGVLYITAPDNIWAIDARTARQIWRYTYPANPASTSATAARPSTRTPST